MPIKEECCLCGKVMSYYSLKRCVHCRRLYCSTCIEYGVDGNIICLNCARRIVSPPKLGTKYSPLTRYLARRAKYTNSAILSFRQIEGIIGDSLPVPAYKDVEWWKNNRSSTQGQAWVNVGWHVESVDLEKRSVVLRREGGILKPEKKRVRKSRGLKQFQKPLPIATPRKRRVPSKTRMAKMIARLKNIERKKMTATTFHGQPKSRPTHEKKLFRSTKRA